VRHGWDDRPVNLDLLPEELRRSARIEGNGEVAWSLLDARAAVDALADAGVIVLGLDLRTYGDDGSVAEVAWSVFDPSSTSDPVQGGRRSALDALARPDLPGDWVLVTVAD
jgi:hypothetical protein